VPGRRGDGTVYVGLKDHVEVYNAAGELKTSWASLGDKAYITSISIHDSDVWVADAGGGASCVARPMVRSARNSERLIGTRHSGLIVPSAHLTW